MSDIEIEKLEKTIQKKLPNWYKKFLAEYPEDLINLMKKITFYQKKF